MATKRVPADQIKTTPVADLTDPAVQGAQNYDEIAIRTIAAAVKKALGGNPAVTPTSVAVDKGHAIDAIRDAGLDDPAIVAIADQVTALLWERMQADPTISRVGFVTGAPVQDADAEAERLADAALRAFNDFLLRGDRALSPEQRATLQVDSDIGGGFLTAPEKWIAELVKAVDNVVVMRERATVHPVDGADSLGVPTLETDVSDPTWTAELSIGTEDTGVETGKRALHPHPLAKYIKVSKTLLKRSRIGVDALIRDRLAYKAGVAMENGYLNGTGANQPLGLFVANDAGVSTSRDVTCSAVVADVVEGDDLIEAQYTLKQQYWPNAVWIMHRDLAKVIRKLKSTNNYLWAPGLGGSPATILNMEYILSEYAPNTYTASLYTAILGDLSYYWIADAMTSLEIQVLLELYAATNQNAYIMRFESDGMPVLAEAFVRLKMAAA